MNDAQISNRLNLRPFTPPSIRRIAAANYENYENFIEPLVKFKHNRMYLRNLFLRHVHVKMNNTLIRL